MRVSIKPKVTVRPEIKGHRPPKEYINLLTKSELEFRNYIRNIESDKIFQHLVSEGLVKKIHFRGRIPHHLYQEFQDKEFMGFLEKYDITGKVDWESDFFDKEARSKSKKLSAKYDVPRGELIKALEYCRHLLMSWDGSENDISMDLMSLDEPDQFLQPQAEESWAESDDSIAILSELMEEYSISEDEFIRHFLGGSGDPYDIAMELDIDVNVTADIIEALEHLQMMGVAQVNVVDRQQKTDSSSVQQIATITRLKNPPRAEIQIDANEQYGYRYDIKISEENIDKEETEFIEKLRLINQRRTLTFRIVSFLFEVQYQYFVSGNELHLKPLSQAQIAKEVGEHESTISRIIKNKSLEIPEGVFTLKYFCQSKGDVIKRLINIREKQELEKGVRDKPFSDAEISEILENEYDTKVSRRTVTYHRNRLKETPKYYKRKRQIDKKS